MNLSALDHAVHDAQ
jgi:hypothetical protein